MQHILMEPLLFLYVSIAGMIGNSLSYMIALWDYKVYEIYISIVIVNSFACYATGLLYAANAQLLISNYNSIIMSAGLIGGFSTFDSFTGNLYRMAQTKNYVILSLYLIIYPIIAFFLVYLGWATVMVTLNRSYPDIKRFNAHLGVIHRGAYMHRGIFRSEDQ